MLNQPDRDQATPLHYAALHGRTELILIAVPLLRSIDSGFSVSTLLDEDHATLLHYAAVGGHLSASKALLKEAPQLIAQRTLATKEDPAETARNNGHTELWLYLSSTLQVYTSSRAGVLSSSRLDRTQNTIAFLRQEAAAHQRDSRNSAHDIANNLEDHDSNRNTHIETPFPPSSDRNEISDADLTAPSQMPLPSIGDLDAKVDDDDVTAQAHFPDTTEYSKPEDEVTPATIENADANTETPTVKSRGTRSHKSGADNDNQPIE